MKKEINLESGAVLVSAAEVEALSAAEMTESGNVGALSSLAEIDRKSVRGIREFLLSKFANDALLPAQLVTHEAAAQAERAKFK